jgi:hypothetical protein
VDEARDPSLRRDDLGETFHPDEIMFKWSGDSVQMQTHAKNSWRNNACYVQHEPTERKDHGKRPYS